MTPAAAERLFNLKLEMTELERDERMIDNHLKWLKQVSMILILGLKMLLLTCPSVKSRSWHRGRVEKFFEYFTGGAQDFEFS